MDKRTLEIGYLDPRKMVGNTIYCKLFQENVNLWLQISSNSNLETHEGMMMYAPSIYTINEGLADKDNIEKVDLYIIRLALVNKAEIRDNRSREALDLTEKLCGLRKIVSSLREVAGNLEKDIKL